MTTSGIQPDGSYRPLTDEDRLHRKKLIEGVLNEQFANHVAGDLAGALSKNNAAIASGAGELVGERFIIFMSRLLDSVNRDREILPRQEFEEKAIVAIAMVLTGDDAIDQAIAASCLEALDLEERLANDI